MSNPFFSFKKFTVTQARSAMKVGTDGVLLGAWCSLPNNTISLSNQITTTDTTLEDSSKKTAILDIGSGTGLIALMLAQRTESFEPPHSIRIDAVEIDVSSCEDAAENFAASPWSDRLFLYHTPFSEFARSQTKRYELIVTNPPYFSNSLQCPDHSRTAARHNTSLPFEEIIRGCNSLLTPTGRLAIILPPQEADLFIKQASSEGLHLLHRLNIRPTAASTIKRVAMEFSLQTSLPYDSHAVRTESLTVEADARHTYTQEYIALTKAFYLKF